MMGIRRMEEEDKLFREWQQRFGFVIKKNNEKMGSKKRVVKKKVAKKKAS